MQYFFNSPRFPQLKRDSKSEEFSKAIVKLWAYFARTGYNLRFYMKIPSRSLSMYVRMCLHI
jgi:hypothetical protein